MAKPKSLESSLTSIRLNPDHQCRLVIEGNDDVKRTFYDLLAKDGKLFYQSGTPIIAANREEIAEYLSKAASFVADVKVVHPLSTEIRRDQPRFFGSISEGVAHVIGRKHKIDAFVLGNEKEINVGLKDVDNLVNALKQKNIIPSDGVPHNRRDPFNEVVEYGDLVTARDLIKYAQNEGYLKKYPMPAPPLGHIPWEVIRQITTFLLPLIAMFAGVKFWGWGTLWVTFPLGFLCGWQMDRSLDADITKTRQRDEFIDRGRNRAVQILSARLGIPPDEITLEMITKMARDCDWREQKAKEREAHEAAEAQARRNLSRRQESTLVAKKSHSSKTAVTTFAATTTATVTAATSATEASDADDDRYWRDSYDSYLSVNPTSGLPMAPGGLMIDVGGNAFGTGGFDN